MLTTFLDFMAAKSRLVLGASFFVLASFPIVFLRDGFRNTLDAECVFLGFWFILCGFVQTLKARQLKKVTKPRKLSISLAALSFPVGLSLILFSLQSVGDSIPVKNLPVLKPTMMVDHISNQWIQKGSSENLSPEEIQRGFEEEVNSVYPVVLERAKNGEADSQLWVGMQNLHQKPTEAIHWFQKAAGQGNTQAMIQLAYAYEKGNGINADSKLALKWFEKAAKGKDASAMRELAQRYLQGWTAEQDYTKAIEWYGKAAEYGDRASLYSLGTIYEEGLGVSVDLKKAAAWYLEAAQSGNFDAMDKIAEMYESGKGIEKNSEEAEKWRKNAKSPRRIVY